MDIITVLIAIAGLSYLSYTIFLANQEEIAPGRGNWLRFLLYGVIAVTFLYALFVLQLGFVQLPADLQMPPIDSTAAVVSFVLTLVLCFISLRTVASSAMRARIRRILPASASYNPDSPVHTVAVVLSLTLLSITIGQFVFGGGLSGMAQSLDVSGIDVNSLFFEEILWVFVAVLGVGMYLRRSPPKVLERLGVRLPTPQDATWGVVVGLVLFGFVIALSAVWALVTSPAQFQQQTAASSEFAASFNSLPLALIISVLVAIGEELFFRGALQPVFGNFVTSLFFTALHTQYTLTPATLAILATSLALGWLRQRYSTSASMIGHFVYNFVQLALAVLTGSSV